MSSSGLFCTNCGHQNEPQAAFCAKCGAPQQSNPTVAGVGPYADQYGNPVLPGQVTGAATAYGVQPYAAAPVSYAGFWIRFLAYLIDSVIIGAVSVPLILLFVGASVAGHASESQDAAALAVLAMFPIFTAIFLGGGWLYYALLESSAKQGTVGKMVLKLRVTDLNGQRLGFGHATGRYFAKLINSFTFFIGWIMAGFTQKKQALHDIIAGTLVLKTNS
jgi:uncharacterized RDD family membrane protein YckC